MNWVLLTGLVRNPEIALTQARRLQELKTQGLVEGVVFSTWAGEFDRYPDVREAFRALGAILLESVEPNLRLPGHVLHQSLSVLRGLDPIPDGAKVLKIRPDLAPIDILIEILLKGRWLDEADISGGNPTAYKRKIWAHSGLVAWPFYLNDIIIYADKAELRQLADIDIKQEWLYADLAPEQFFHLGPITKVNQTLRLFAKLQRGKHDMQKNERLFDLLWQNDFWYDVLRASAQEFLNNYFVGFTPPQTVYSEEYLNSYRAYSIGDLLAPHTQMRQFESRPNFGGNVFHSLGWARALLDGRFRDDVVKTRFDARASATSSDIAQAGDAFREALAQAFEDYAPKSSVNHDGILRQINGHARLMGLETDEANRQLQSEINHLRRELERLTVK